MGDDVDVDVTRIVLVAVIVTGANSDEATMGSVTPVHREVVFEKTQHESVAFGELAPQ